MHDPLSHEERLFALAGHVAWLSFGTSCMDIYGRTLAFLNFGTGNNDMYQHQLLRRGYARVYTFSDNHTFATAFEADGAVAEFGQEDIAIVDVHAHHGGMNCRKAPFFASFTANRQILLTCFFERCTVLVSKRLSDFLVAEPQSELPEDFALATGERRVEVDGVLQEVLRGHSTRRSRDSWAGGKWP